jgi:hypothetical protein
MIASAFCGGMAYFHRDLYRLGNRIKYYYSRKIPIPSHNSRASSLHKYRNRKKQFCMR